MLFPIILYRTSMFRVISEIVGNPFLILGQASLNICWCETQLKQQLLKKIYLFI